MSRIAKKPITIPAGVTVDIKGQHVEIKGPKGSLAHELHSLVKVTLKDNELLFEAIGNSKNAIAQSGTARSLLNNMVIGVSAGFERKLLLVGVGYRAKAQGSTLNLTLGLSHPVNHEIPKGITAETPSNTEIILRGFDKHLIGQVAADIRAYRPPEPYKGKGIRYAEERVSLKETKKK